MATIDSVLRIVITTTLRPFVRLLLRYGISFADVSAILRKLYVEVADEEFKIAGRKQSHARIAVLTGLTRREVKKVMAESPSESGGAFKLNRAAWALSGWSSDTEFLTEQNQPKELSITESGPGTFESLIKKYGGDVPYRSILDELLRVGAVKRLANNTVVPTSTGYVPAADNEELLRISFQSVADHISTIDFNDQNSPDASRLQLTVNYDNVTQEGMEIFRHLSREKSKELLLYLDRFLATQDRDTNTTLIGEGKVRTGISIFYFEEHSTEEGVVDDD